MQFLKYLLLPFAFLYGVGVSIRNALFDFQILKSQSFDVPIIGIGNLSTGGTGKTPMAEYILQLLLKNGYRPAMLSRGYNRQSKGYLEVKSELNASLCGDEPYQVKSKIPGVFVAVCEDRVSGIKTILKDNPEINVIVLDDSFQHRYVKPGFNILLTDYSKPYYKDFLMPAGMLREPVSGRKRADVIVVTKWPGNINADQKDEIKQKLEPMSGQEVFYTGISYQSLVNTGPTTEQNQTLSVENLAGYKVLLFSGIANTKPLELYLKSHGIELILIKFHDHHYFTDEDAKRILSVWHGITNTKKLLLTSEKDWRRLEGTSVAGLISNQPLYYLPIEMLWEPAENLIFNGKILEYVKSNQRRSWIHP